MAISSEISPQDFNKKLAEQLKKMPEFQAPAWLSYVKTSSHKQRPTQDEEFWHKRAASILKQVGAKGIVGVSRLRSRYGGRKNNGMKPATFKKSGGKIIRTLLQQAESAGLLEKSKSKRAGRQLTVQGRQLLEGIK